MDLNDPRFNFAATPTLDEIIPQQGKVPIADIQALRGTFWPEDEPMESFVAALHDWRGHGKTSKSDPAT